MAGASSSSASRLTFAIPSDYSWLSPAYDPNITLRVELRRILRTHHIPLHNASTKVAMVKLFKERIQTNRPALIASLTSTPEPQPQPRPSERRRRRRQSKTAAAAAGDGSSISSSDESAERGSRDHSDHGDHDDSHDNDDRTDHQAAKRTGAPPKPQSGHPLRAMTIAKMPYPGSVVLVQVMMPLQQQRAEDKPAGG
ncbi:MAG: hypothetical protein OHK93_003321 [Ramalina farinacea]|uniref:Uncharacterized protein n=1 Tax=Ramalina farinacea TaxID=258253 RepID=A0AA43QV19_9LECA|nr:hypothetical protein [Ramalina farinacea]